jgi:hypothetical protein
MHEIQCDAAGIPNLRFVGPTLMPTLGGTAASVRLGDQWYTTVLAGEPVHLWVCRSPHTGECDPDDCEDFGRATVTQTWHGPLWELPTGISDLFPDPRCHGLRNVVHRLSELYRVAVHDDMPVTAIVFWRPRE